MIVGGFKILGSSTGAVAVTNNQWVMFMDYVGPASYTTGGFVIDLTPTFSSINSAVLRTITQGANLPAVRYEYDLNAPVAGKITVKIMKKMYDRVSSVGAVTNQPAGVTVQATSGVASSSESSHTHTIDHNHGSFASGVNGTGGGQVLVDALGPQMDAHTHQLDLANLTGTSGAGTAHSHVDNTIYEHAHAVTHTATNLTSTELANATNLSGSTLKLLVTGIKV